MPENVVFNDSGEAMLIVFNRAILVLIDEKA
jgi:hypothetical protein